MNTQKITVLLGIISLNLVCACSLVPGIGIENLPLVGTPWTLTGLTGQQLPPDITITAGFDVEGRVNGSSGCNNYKGPYTADVNQITIGPLAQTRKACPPPVMALEEAGC